MSDRARFAVFAILALVLLLGLTAGLVALQAGAAAKRVADALSGVAAIQHGRVLVNMSGDLLVRDVRIVPKSNPGLTVMATRARIVSPGPVWLFAATFGGDAGIPATDHLRVELEDVRVDGTGEIAPGLGFIGWTTGAPFEAAGCAPVERWTLADLSQMSLRTQPARVTVDYQVQDSGISELAVDLTVPGSSRMQHRRLLKLANPREPLANSPADASLVELGWSVRDDGFIATRNRYCANRLRITRNLVVQRHLDAIAQWLEARGLMAEPDAIDAYRRYAARGEDLVLVATPSAPATFAALSKLDPAARSLVLDATIESSGRSPVKFALRPAQAMDFVGPPEPPGRVAGVGGVANGVGANGTGANAVGANGVAANGVPSNGTTATGVAATQPGRRPAESRDDVSGGGSAGDARATRNAAPVAANGASGSANTATIAANTTTGSANTAASASTTGSNTPSTPTPRTTPVAPTATRPNPSITGSPALASRTPAGPATTPRPGVPRGTAKPGPVGYDQLANALGRRVQIDTVFHSRRTGVVRDFNREAVTLEVPERNGSMLITFPRATVVRAQVLDSRYIPESTDAQAN